MKAADVRTSNTAKCPYYKYHTEHEIVCEGFCNGNTLHLTYGMKRKTLKYRREYCEEFGYLICPIYKMIVQEEEKNDTK